jgi:hypothetical protein
MLKTCILALFLGSAAAFSASPALRLGTSNAASARQAKSVATRLTMQDNSQEISRRKALGALAGLVIGTVSGTKVAFAEDPEVDLYIGAGCFWHVQVRLCVMKNTRKKGLFPEFDYRKIAQLRGYKAQAFSS